MEQCNCINKIFDLAVSARGSTRMVIDDHSVWMNEDGFSGALSFDVSVKTLTRRGMVNTVPLFVGSRTVLTAKDLGVGEADDCIKDDIYCFTTISCGLPMSINRAFLPGATCALDVLLANRKDEIDDKIINDVERLIAGIEAQVELNRVEEAKGTYKILEEKLKNLVCDYCN